MSKNEKILMRLLSRPKDFAYDELKKLLSSLGYIEDHVGKTSGSRVAFYNNETKDIIRIHKPHPGNILKSYVIDQVIEKLHVMGVI